MQNRALFPGTLAVKTCPCQSKPRLACARIPSSGRRSASEGVTEGIFRGVPNMMDFAVSSIPVSFSPDKGYGMTILAECDDVIQVSNLNFVVGLQSCSRVKIWAVTDSTRILLARTGDPDRHIPRSPSKQQSRIQLVYDISPFFRTCKRQKPVTGAFVFADGRSTHRRRCTQ